ncbi:MAG: aspartate kinase [Bacteroidota bacterium]
MKVYKFGGGVIQNSESIRKLAQLIQAEKPGSLVVVVSALGKTTQALEEILQCQVAGQPYAPQLQKLYEFHRHMIDQLLDGLREVAYQMLNAWQDTLLAVMRLPITDVSSDKTYSRIVAEGELLASRLIAYYLQEQQVACTWLDARDYVKTNWGFCHAQVDWATTQRLIQNDFLPLLGQKQVVLTQGFIGSNEKGETTTLGKEGSDFTGAILAAALGAESLTIWKDVPGVMNADPKLFEEATKFSELSYQAMEEMAFYGAKVVHPKTIQPLAAHHIPLYVRPFHDPHERGTVVMNGFAQVEHPIYVLQENQVLVQLSLDDLTFFSEACMQEVVHQLEQQDLRANLMEREAFKLTMCLNNDHYQTKGLAAALGQRFRINAQPQVNLLTVLHGDERLGQAWLAQKEVLLAHQRPDIYQAVFQPDAKA